MCEACVKVSESAEGVKHQLTESVTVPVVICSHPSENFGILRTVCILRGGKLHALHPVEPQWDKKQKAFLSDQSKESD